MALFHFIRENAPFLAAGAVLSFLSSFGQTYFIAIFSAEIMSAYSLSDGAWGGLYTVSTTASPVIGLGEPPSQEPAIVIGRERGSRIGKQAILEAAAEKATTRAIRKVFFSSAFPVDVRHNAKINRLELARRHQDT